MTVTEIIAGRGSKNDPPSKNFLSFQGVNFFKGSQPPPQPPRQFLSSHTHTQVHLGLRILVCTHAYIDLILIRTLQHATPNN